ncbi:type II toxin-antitoxin system HicA family toxin [Acinetobacter populi]|uniref:Hexulose-6-phosphate synthase n=1 Tax=Acinetobacter populi TaxID=1582270 RepID=A0A1Z9Z358_9GAMM|nr:type II toxin-antitoxin system HicA family toxin [Acinetobacter populi]OUY08862.1 hexulose-6-phosphate synthase [Acinetobacter populi]
MKKQHQKTLEAIFKKPISGNIAWKDIESLFKGLGAEIEEREGSRIAVILFGQVKVFHRPHPQPTTDKGAIASIRAWLSLNDVTP